MYSHADEETVDSAVAEMAPTSDSRVLSVLGYSGLEPEQQAQNLAMCMQVDVQKQTLKICGFGLGDRPHIHTHTHTP